MKIKKYLLPLVIFSLTVYLSISKTSGWIVTSLEMLRLRRAFNASKTFIDYFPHVWQWLLNLSKNGVDQFSLNYVLPAPLLYIFGEEIGFKLFFAIFGGLVAVFVYFFINKIFKPSSKKDRLITFISTLILIFSYGFIIFSGVSLMDPSMVFFLLLALYFFLQEKYFLFGVFITIGALCKMPILAIIPGLFIYILFFKKELFLNKKLWLSGILGMFLFFGINNLVGKNANINLWILADAIPSVNAFDQFKFVYLRNLFVTAPILTILGILGLINLSKKEKNKLLPIIFSVFSLAFFYFSSNTVGYHYIYFLFPALAIFSYFFLKTLSFKSIVVLFLINLSVFVYSYREEPVFSPFHKSNLPELAKIVQNNLKEKEFILTHHGVWDYYLWGKPYTVIKEIQWYGDRDIRKSKIPPAYVENTGVIILSKDFLNQLPEWQYFNQFRFEKEIDNWDIFVRKREDANELF